MTACNVAPPKKDDEQSGLQLALKAANFDIANLLIEQDADVNFMKTSGLSEWAVPVLPGCIQAVVFNSYTLRKNTRKFDKAFSLLQLMLDNQASYGNSCLHRANDWPSP
ncbi:MAG TPA: hypothetical protein VGB84_07010 [Arachidicoccus sp.]